MTGNYISPWRNHGINVSTYGCTLQPRTAWGLIRTGHMFIFKASEADIKNLMTKWSSMNLCHVSITVIISWYMTKRWLLLLLIMLFYSTFFIISPLLIVADRPWRCVSTVHKITNSSNLVLGTQNWIWYCTLYCAFSAKSIFITSNHFSLCFTFTSRWCEDQT